VKEGIIWTVSFLVIIVGMVFLVTNVVE
jgi:hypothetical protein